jgi:hypothetical protein
MFDPTENAEDKMSDALVFGCIGLVVAALVVAGIVATLVKVWL